MAGDEVFGNLLREHRQRRGVSQRSLAKRIYYSNTMLSMIEAARRSPTVELAQKLDEFFESGTLFRDLALSGNGNDLLRSGLTATFVESVMSDATLDDWTRDVLRLGEATRYDHPKLIISRIQPALDTLRNVMSESRTGQTKRDLCKLTAELSGLMSLTLLKFGDFPGSWDWVRTARMFASESEDPATQSWVIAQEAYWYYYSADLPNTVYAAQRARELSRTPTVGAALASAVAARAESLRGDEQETLRSIGTAEEMLAGLSDDQRTPSAFGYNEAQLRFHEESALTQLRNVERAIPTQTRALELCAEGDYVDRTLITLDRADCLAATGDVASAVATAKEALLALVPEQQKGILLDRARDTLNGLSGRDDPSVREFSDLIAHIHEVTR